MNPNPTTIRLQGAHTEIVVDASGGVPAILHWGAPLGPGDAAALAMATDRPIVFGAPDVVAPVTVVPEHGSAFPGRPGLLGRRRRGTAWAPRFEHVSHTVDGDGHLEVTAADRVAGLTLVTRMSLDELLTVSVEVHNDADDRYLLDGLTVTLPIPERAVDLLSFEGRWTREFQPIREPWHHGARTAENRRGRTSSEHPSLLFAGTAGFGEWSGEVWGAHLAWSGNHVWLAERLADGRRVLQFGELLHPGEIALAPGGSYRTPDLLAVHATDGLTAATQQFHRHLRSRPGRPERPRPVLVNTWEAVYFDHDLDRLRSLAERAARIGTERFVLDDGWFGSRRDATSGLGDWVVSADAHPGGLAPLIDHVRSLGMEFGIWVEPEMVNPDSDLYRAHPDWALTVEGYEPVLARNQLVLDLTRPEVVEHVLERLDALLTDHDIAFVKWDMNRDHIAAATVGGSAATHAQTLAVYALLDELRARHPAVEFESCSSGGGRVDHAVLQRTERVWASDCNDAVERQRIQFGLSMLVPPEVIGAHIGPERSHTTGRRHDLAFRAATALFGHLGVEADLLRLTDPELDALAEAIALHRRFRPLLHSGDTVRFDTDPSLVAHGVYAADRSEALVSVARMATARSLTPPPLVLPGLDASAVYDVTPVGLPGPQRSVPSQTRPAWATHGVALSGAALARVGLQLPVLHPETALLVHLVRRPD